MSIFKNLSFSKSYKKATVYWKQLSSLLIAGNKDALEQELAKLQDLRTINMIINCTFMARMRGMGNEQLVLKPLMLAHAEKIISNITDLAQLADINSLLVEDAKRDQFCVNQLEGLIAERTAAL